MTLFSSRMNRKRFRRFAVAAALAVLPPVSALAAAPNPSCSEPAPLESLRLSSLSPVAAAPATMVLPPDGEARVLFAAAMGTSKDPRAFRAFEVPRLSDRASGREIDILGVDEATDKEKDRLKAKEGVVLSLGIRPQKVPWLIRSFVVVACNGDAVDTWGGVSAPVSNPDVSKAICIAVGLIAYVLAMRAIFANRRKQLTSELSTKYPAVFSARALTASDFFNPIHLATNAFNQGSVQKLQVVVFSFLIGELVLSLTLNTGTLTDLSPTVIALLGISGVGAAAAQAAYQQKTRLSFENWAWLSNRRVLKIDKPGKDSGPFWRDLVVTNREFDVYKLQTIVFSVAVIAAIIVGGAANLSTFNVPETLLGILGLSQVVYVGGVLVKPPTNTDLDGAITKLRSAGDMLAAAKAHNTDTDGDGKLLTDTSGRFIDVRSTGDTPGTNALQQYKALEAPMVDMIESALEVEVNPAALDPE